MLSLCCFAWAFPSCSKWGYSLWFAGFSLRCFSCCGPRALGVWAQSLWCMGLVPLRHVGSSQTRNLTCVPCIGRWIPIHCSTREVLAPCFKNRGFAIIQVWWGWKSRRRLPLKRVCYSQAPRIEGALPHGGATQGCTGVLQEVEWWEMWARASAVVSAGRNGWGGVSRLQIG